MRRPLSGLLVALTLAGPAAAAAAKPLSADRLAPSVASSHGSGRFGTWGVDGRGLPRYRYTLDQDRAPEAAQPELNGARDAWHQLGNDHVVANAYNHGWVQLWSQDRLYQWANYVEPEANHFGGGFGWLRTRGKTYSTLYADRPPGTDPPRDFGVGYASRTTPAGGIDVTERVYAPFGDDPVLLHDVVLRNRGRRARRATWFEYWDVNPYRPGSKGHRGIAAPVHDPATGTLTVAQSANAQDAEPLSIFAASLRGPVDGFETDGKSFFGAGGRKAPDAVAADALSGSIAASAPDSGFANTVLVFRSPVTIKPGRAVRLRYAYGMAHGEQVAALVQRYRQARAPFAASMRAWRRWVPRVALGGRHRWLARELQWSAYMLRSGTTYEECAGRHIISQGGYYQYDLGFQGAFRDPLQHMLPMIYAAPAIARDVIAYSAAQQPRGGGQISYARIPQCTRLDLGTAADLDLWLLLSAAEYGLASRDLAFFDEPVPWLNGGSATLWEHLKAGFAHQESQRGPHGGYLSGTVGDWSDLSTQFLQMTESMLVAAQTAYVYPRLAELADARGDTAFAAKLRATAEGLLEVLRREWTGKGWFSRGYSGVTQIGRGAIFGEPQPWALLAGAADPEQARTLVANIRRFLTGIGAPGGPERIGSSQSPATDDPEVTERSLGGVGGVGDNHAVFVGGSWFAVNGWLTWALGELDGIVPNAREYAFDELKRNTLATRGTVYPGHWNGILSVDDACRSWYSTNPERCGIGLSSGYSTQIMHQPAWLLFDTIRLAGISPTADGYRIAPHLPLRRYSLRLPRIGVAVTPRTLRGYVRPVAAATLRLRVALPAGTGRVVAYAGGRRVAARRQDGFVVFDLPARANRPADWAVVITPPT